MPKVTIQSVLLGVAVTVLTIYLALETLGNSPIESNTDTDTEVTATIPKTYIEHPILGKSKQEISNLYPGNCFAELYLENPSFGGKLVNSCKQKTIEQIKAVTGIKIDTSELTSVEVVQHLKNTYGVGNPWRL